MTKIVLKKKNYVILPEEEFLSLQKKAVLKSKPAKTFTIKEARQYSKELIHKWANEK